MTDFVRLTIAWYTENSRVLPWRSTKNPYFIWLSEVILQQTRVDQGRKYYENFTKTYPFINDLAKADEENVLKLWQGLGYYSRARNLHKTAQIIANDYNGQFPNDYKQILQLKGIGPYTAAAIASFAFDLPHAVVDGNVYRILSRYFGIDLAIDSTAGKKAFQALADSLIPIDNAATYNQAIMEFGAMQCTQNNPNCANCPLFESCDSGRSQLYTQRPVKEKKTKVTKRYFHYFHFETATETAIKKRSNEGIWENLYEFPMIETDDKTIDFSAFQLVDAQPKLLFETKHILSHQHIFAHFYRVSSLPDSMTFELVATKNVDDLPIHRLMEKYFDQLYK
ncbi:MAG: A/G-specific adenine glycosylase [Fluviicola sp.]|nr:A/G-specific adenine glycosylase [Fluviicola sp.]